MKCTWCGLEKEECSPVRIETAGALPEDTEAAVDHSMCNDCKSDKVEDFIRIWGK